MRTPARVLIVAPSPPPYGGMALQARLLERMLGGDGIDVRFFASNQSVPPLFTNISGIRTIVRLLLTCIRLTRAVGRADIVHILAASWVYFFVLVWPAVIIARLLGKHIVLNYRGGEAALFFRRFGWACRPVFRLATVVTAPSTFLSEVIGSRFGVPVSIVPNIVNLSDFTYHSRSRFRPKMLVTRHLQPMYDIATVIRAARVVQNCYLEASLWIAGTGPEESALRQLAMELKLNNVRFLGAISHREMPAVHAECDILLNASRVDNFPGALLEASASGLAIISTNPGGIPHIYQHNISALLVEPGNSEELARSVMTVLESPEVGIRLTRNALRLAQSCDWKEVCKPLYQAYGLIPEDRPDAAVCVSPGRC